MKVIVANHEVWALVDTGAQDTIVNASAFPNVDTTELTPTTQSIRLADQSSVKVAETYTATFDIGGVTLEEPVVVMNELSHAMLLGSKFLRKYAFGIDWEVDTLTLSVSELPQHANDATAPRHVTVPQQSGNLENVVF